MDPITAWLTGESNDLFEIVHSTQVIRPHECTVCVPQSEVSLFFDPILNPCLILEYCFDLENN